MITSRSWLTDMAEVRPSRIHGQGVFAKEKIPKDHRVAVFGGDIMLIDEMRELPPELQEFSMQIEERFVLGSRTALKGEETDYFNHSCDPNLGFRGQIFLVAMRDIDLGEELCFDYAMVLSTSVGSSIVFQMACSCGSAQCRKTITEDDWLLPFLRERYAGYFSQYLQELISAKQ